MYLCTVKHKLHLCSKVQFVGSFSVYIQWLWSNVQYLFYFLLSQQGMEAIAHYESFVIQNSPQLSLYFMQQHNLRKIIQPATIGPIYASQTQNRFLAWELLTKSRSVSTTQPFPCTIKTCNRWLQYSFLSHILALLKAWS